MSFEFDAPPTVSTNLSVTRDCTTCGGDRMVVYATRAVTQTAWMRERGIEPKGEIEEYAPCPDCNPDANTLRHGFKSPDPAQVRSRLQQ